MAVAPETMIEAHGLKRVYRTRGKAIEAVKGIDLTVKAGEIVGFLGPNGAGKTTTLKMLCTLLEPTGGTAKVAGLDLRADPVGVRRRIGYVSQSGSTSELARVGNEITWHAELYGIAPKAARERAEELLSALDLEDVWDRKCAALSGGQRRRLDIVMGLIHRPQLVFLDEPSTGLDPQSRANLWTHIRKLRDDFGTTVFLTTHYMDEADSLSDRILIIDHGTIVREGTPKELKKRVSGDAITLTLRDTGDAEAAAAITGALVGASEPNVEGNVVRIQVQDGAAALAKLLKDMNSIGVEAIGVEVAQPTLDDVFLALTGRTLRD
ncbi:ATP-binding cassette domain-containing protein [Solirhodobacter olei]|uniref:ATP-binding cassette domain-containing protein n=1 Tax=Solirhodobacter olei TaxID=2493082 RepID=UPI0019D4C5CF|nr:ATP-binding cassette domain-containing protein [Solirhodobacter olei]